MNDPTLPMRGPDDLPGSGEALPPRIGPFAIKRRIASGGMGTIFEGVQEEPRRTVAVKVMRRGIASPEALRRFQYESQILARLRHPGIAQVYQAGTHGEGDDALPFFAMEYIPNAKPITEYAEGKNLSVRDRLNLFVRVCDAVHYGHQKGIIHRDLKPSNILVDSQGNPRIIDFGVARATDSDLALATFQTEVGQLIGSLQYMSPEQFEADPHDIDTRSDVYALGLVLYELLSGKLPYDLSRTAVYEAARVVREVAPRRLREQSPSSEGELETVVHKAMEKDRDQRYQSAFGLAQDIRRFLSGETIAARPPSLSYQVRVFARRNKGLLAAVAGVFGVLAIGVVVSTSLYIHAEHERQRAESQTAKAEAATEFLSEMLKETLPRGYGEQVTVAEMLDLSRKNVTTAFPDQPEVEAEVCQTIGWGYLNLSRWEDSEEHLERALALRSQALGRDDPATLESLEALAILYSATGQDQDLVETQTWVRESRARVLGEDHARTVEADYVLATGLWRLGRLDEAEKVATQTAESRRRVLGENHPDTFEARILVAGLQLSRGMTEKAESSSREILSACEGSLGRDHLITRSARSQLAMVLLAQGEYEEAAGIYGHRPPPAEFGIESRFQGDFVPEASGTHVLVFWETWCPFSQLAVPKLEAVYQRYRSRGLDIVGLCEVDRSSTPEKVRKFISEKGLTFPILKTNDRPWKYYEVRGTPWVTVVRNGELIWENCVDTPEKLPGMMVDGLVQDSG